MQQPTGELGQRGIATSSWVFSEVGRCYRIYDSRCSHCLVLQELFDHFDYNSSVDILSNEEKTPDRSYSSRWEIALRCFERNCGWLFDSILSCFAVQVSITLLQLTYSWSQQVILILNDLFIGDMSVEHLKRTTYRVGNLEVVWWRTHRSHERKLDLLHENRFIEARFTQFNLLIWCWNLKGVL